MKKDEIKNVKPLLQQHNVSGSLLGWVTIKTESDLPPDDYCGKVEFKIKGGKKTIIGYYEEVYQTFEDDGSDKKNDCCVSWEEVESYRCFV